MPFKRQGGVAIFYVLLHDREMWYIIVCCRCGGQTKLQVKRTCCLNGETFGAAAAEAARFRLL